jgi:hypothetical protein
VPALSCCHATTARGHIEQFPSGSFRVHVYAGTDPVTGKPRRLKQAPAPTRPASPEPDGETVITRYTLRDCSTGSMS